MSKLIRYGVLVVLVSAALIWWWTSHQNNVSDRITDTVRTGTITQSVSVSGFVEADNTVHLTFPTAGRISEVFVSEGAEVEAGTLLATVAQARVAAERRAALANVEKAEAARDELVNGQTREERAITAATLGQARSAWEQTVATELQKVQNALTTLHSNDLRAYSTDPDEDATPPTISGSYVCGEEGEYRISVYTSDTDSGYSFNYDGLETGRGAVTTEQPLPLGTCGLEIQFTAGDGYGRSEWVVSIPNTRSSTYLSYLSALNLAEQQAAQNIQAAKNALTLAENVAVQDTAAPRVEALLSANAGVAAAQAELARIDALIGDQSIYAPFAGTVTDIEKLPGEIATTEPFITLLAQDSFTLTARIPEIDITKVVAGQKATVVFDANATEVLEGTVEYVSPLAVEIDGVAYFEARVVLTNTPDWMRSGLNADIDIITAKKDDALIIPKRYIISENGKQYADVLSGKDIKRTEVTVGFSGNDGFIEVIGLSDAATVVAP